jgi:aminoglycoside phosphotransferase
MTLPARLSLLELLLPAGRARSALVLGAACPGRLRPAVGGTDEQPDLIVVAPDPSEAGSRDWLEHAVATCAARLGGEGLAYVLADPRTRRRVRRLLRRAGLVPGPAFLHLPDPGASRHLIELDQTAASHAFGGVAPLVPWKRGLARVVLAGGGAGAIARSSAGVGVVARRPAAPPLFGWLRGIGGADVPEHAHLLTASWRADGSSVVLHAFGPRSAPPVVAKLALGAGVAGTGEAGRLARLGPTARQAGAQVPEVVGCGRLGVADVLLETAVPGEPLMSLLARREKLLEEAIERLARWLARWHELSAVRRPLTPGDLEREVLGPAEELAPELAGGRGYLDRLAARCAAVTGSPAPLVHAHNDLTMANVLVDGAGGLGVVDWESAEDEALPLKDFFYAVADATAATARYGDRLSAARRCFAPGGGLAPRTARLQNSIAAAAGASPPIVELAFHACWLRHAANERRGAGPGQARPFGEILQWLASGGSRITGARSPSGD